jgi:hypothetical protein
MAEFYNCFDCYKVMPLLGADEKKCPSYGSTNGEAISAQRFEEGFKAGVFYNIPAHWKARQKQTALRQCMVAFTRSRAPCTFRPLRPTRRCSCQEKPEARGLAPK